MKICNMCKKEKEDTEFSQMARSIDKLDVWCKECRHTNYIKRLKRNYLIDDNLPKWNNTDNCKGNINWKQCIGLIIYVRYKSNTYSFKVLASCNNYVTLEYKGDVCNPILTGNLRQGKIGAIIKTRTKEFKINIGDVICDRGRDFQIIDRKYKKDKSKIIRKYYKYKCSCGNIRWIEEGALFKGTQCISCGDGVSYPNKFITSILKQLNIEFLCEYSPKYLDRKKSDFYIPSLKLVIEADGKLGHKGGEVFYSSKYTLEELIHMDNWKDEQHRLNGVYTIRINCFVSDMEYIKENILKSELINYFDFSNIDWELADINGQKNIIKEVCNYYNLHKPIGTLDLAHIFNMNRSTITEYLKKGAKFDWCDYDPKFQCKKIEIFKDEISLGIFESIMELSRQSENLFGVKLCDSKISKACKNSKCYKGFVFKSIT